MNRGTFKAVRERLGLTQRELASRLDFSAQQISNYESGRAVIPKLTSLALASLERQVPIPRTSLHFLSEGERAFLQKLVQQLREKLGDYLLLVFLFGSKARGEADAESDTDLLVVLRQKTVRDRHLIFETLFSLDPYNRYALSPLIYSLKEFQMNESIGSPFIAEIKREGILL